MDECEYLCGWDCKDERKFIKIKKIDLHTDFSLTHESFYDS